MEMDRERRRGPRYLFVADTEVTDMPPMRSALPGPANSVSADASLIRGTLRRKAPSFGSESLKEMPHSLRSVVSYLPFQTRG